MKLQQILDEFEIPDSFKHKLQDETMSRLWGICKDNLDTAADLLKEDPCHPIRIGGEPVLVLRDLAHTSRELCTYEYYVLPIQQADFSSRQCSEYISRNVMNEYGYEVQIDLKEVGYDCTRETYILKYSGRIEIVGGVAFRRKWDRRLQIAESELRQKIAARTPNMCPLTAE